MTTKQLFYLPGEDRTITRAGLEAEIEYIGREYWTNIDIIIDDMLGCGLAEEIQPGDPRAAFAEPEARTVLIAELFDAMSDEADDETELLEDLRKADQETLNRYRETFLGA